MRGGPQGLTTHVIYNILYIILYIYYAYGIYIYIYLCNLPFRAVPHLNKYIYIYIYTHNVTYIDIYIYIYILIYKHDNKEQNNLSELLTSYIYLFVIAAFGAQPLNGDSSLMRLLRCARRCHPAQPYQTAITIQWLCTKRSYYE